MRSELSRWADRGLHGPDGITSTPDRASWWMVFSRSEALSISRLARPSRVEQRKIWCSRGLRQSQSISSTRLPLLASRRPSEATITDLPSDGVAELIRIVLGELAVSDSST